MTTTQPTNESGNMLTITKTQSAQSYSWHSIGEGSDTAAKWTVFSDGNAVGIITRESGGRYMEKALWVLRSIEQPEFVIASGKQADCKATAKAHDWTKKMVAYVPRKRN